MNDPLYYVTVELTSGEMIGAWMTMEEYRDLLSIIESKQEEPGVERT